MYIIPLNSTVRSQFHSQTTVIYELCSPGPQRFHWPPLGVPPEVPTKFETVRVVPSASEPDASRVCRATVGGFGGFG